MKVRITDSNYDQLHEVYKDQLRELNIKTTDIEFEEYRKIKYRTIIENFSWDMLPKIMNIREPEWLRDKSRKIVGSVVVSTPSKYDGDVDFSIVLYDGYIE